MLTITAWFRRRLHATQHAVRASWWPPELGRRVALLQKRPNVRHRLAIERAQAAGVKETVLRHQAALPEAQHARQDLGRLVAAAVDGRPDPRGIGAKHALQSGRDGFDDLTLAQARELRVARLLVDGVRADDTVCV